MQSKRAEPINLLTSSSNVTFRPLSSLQQCTSTTSILSTFWCCVCVHNSKIHSLHIEERTHSTSTRVLYALFLTLCIVDVELSKPNIYIFYSVCGECMDLCVCTCVCLHKLLLCECGGFYIPTLSNDGDID